jgi:hypothetical protein
MLSYNDSAVSAITPKCSMWLSIFSSFLKGCLNKMHALHGMLIHVTHAVLEGAVIIHTCLSVFRTVIIFGSLSLELS